MSLTGKRDAGDEDGGQRGERGLAVPAGAVGEPGHGEPAERRERRHHEDEMAQAIIERRPRHHGEGDGQDCGERHQDQRRRGG